MTSGISVLRIRVSSKLSSSAGAGRPTRHHEGGSLAACQVVTDSDWGGFGIARLAPVDKAIGWGSIVMTLCIAVLAIVVPLVG
ncbi:hypothetical protein ACWEBX_39835 [Streptomyces sp. NPDC005070]